MTLLADVFNKKKPFVGYVTVGHGGLERSFEMACAFVDGGVDILELGVPFSDPIADGPVIQKAMQNALEHQVTLSDVFEFATRLRQRYPMLPLVLFGYYNVFLQAISHGFFEKVKQAGFSGVLVVDLPLEEGEAFLHDCKSHELSQIFLVTPATDDDRLKHIIQQASGFIYYVCHKGTTGARNQLPADFEGNMKRIKTQTSVPVVAGFGIASRDMAQAVLQKSDGFVVGSKLVAAIDRGDSVDEMIKLVQSINPQ